jgi:hypothetical protein
LPPSATLPKLKLVGFSVNCPTAVVDPVPVNAIVEGDAGSLLVIVILPVSFCAAIGEYVAVNVADWPGVIVFGVVIPLTPNAAPETVTIEMVKLAVPAFVNVTAEVLDVPVVTFPKLTLAGLMLNCGFATKVVAVSGTVAVAVFPAASLKFSVNVPVTVPPAVSLNHTVAFAA